MRAFAALASLLVSVPAVAQSIYVGADPLPYALHGFSAHVGVAFPRASFEAAVFASTVGDTLLKLVEPADAGFSERLRGLTAEGYWHFAVWDRNALMAGLQLHFDRATVRHESAPDEAQFDQIYAFPTIAYRFFPFDGLGFFLKPFAGLGLPILSRPKLAVGSRSFDQLRVFPLATVLVGYQF